MPSLLGLVSLLWTGKELIKEAREAMRPAKPANVRIDEEAFLKDLKTHSINWCVEKQNRGGYDTTEPEPPREPFWWELPMDTVVDTERYSYDKLRYGRKKAKSWKEQGYYRRVFPLDAEKVQWMQEERERRRLEKLKNRSARADGENKT